jgi:hypothetical protein
VKNRKHSIYTLPAGVRTIGSRKLAGTKRNKPKYNAKKNHLESWDKSQCKCGKLLAACPPSLHRDAEFFFAEIVAERKYWEAAALAKLKRDIDNRNCREMSTRRCPLTGCVGLPCARFESNDATRWYLDELVWAARRA